MDFKVGDKVEVLFPMYEPKESPRFPKGTIGEISKTYDYAPHIEVHANEDCWWYYPEELVKVGDSTRKKRLELEAILDSLHKWSTEYNEDFVDISVRNQHTGLVWISARSPNVSKIDICKKYEPGVKA